MDVLSRLNALANRNRLAVLRWLDDPSRYFRHPSATDVGPLGVSCTALRRKLRITAASTTRHMQILLAAGFVEARRDGKFTYYRRVEGALHEFSTDLSKL